MTSDFKNGISYYTVGRAIIEVGFPENRVCCEYCDRLIADSLRRPMCSLTRKLIFAPASIDYDCPVVFEEKEGK